MVEYNPATDLIFQKTSDLAFFPERATRGSVGWDLRLPIDVSVPPHSAQANQTYLRLLFPTGVFGLIKERSSFFLSGIIISGVIDTDYVSGITVNILNTNSEPFQSEYSSSSYSLLTLYLSTVSRGTRCAQLILMTNFIPRCIRYRESSDESPNEHLAPIQEEMRIVSLPPRIGGLGSTGRF